MRILDFIILIYYFPLKGYKEKGLEGGILLATLPISFFIIALVFYLSHFFIPKESNIFNPITYGIIGGFVFFTINWFLKRNYLNKYESIRDLGKRLNNYFLKVLILVASFCFYVISVVFVFYSFKFT